MIKVSPHKHSMMKNRLLRHVQGRRRDYNSKNFYHQNRLDEDYLKGQLMR
jgi:hypothetical protein